MTKWSNVVHAAAAALAQTVRGCSDVVRSFVEHPRHRFWPDGLAYPGVDMKGVIGHRQVTDAYLATLARSQGGRLATFDQGMAALHADVVDLVASSG